MRNYGLLFFSLLLIFSCATRTSPPPLIASASTPVPVQEQGEDFTLQVLHFGDTHSRVDGSPISLRIDIDEQNKACPVYVNAGGYLLAADAVKNLRWQSDTLLLHAGDLFQGTLYFTRYQGETDLIAMNKMGIDALVLGNHEFDKGPALIQQMLLNRAKFPVLAANVDFSKEAAITSKEKIQPYIIKKYEGERVAVIGLTSPDTPLISSPGGNTIFNDPAKTAQTIVDKLTAEGINKIILLTHMGITEDMALATKLYDVDVIIGGHSHSLTGKFGLNSVGAYPTIVRDKEGKNVLIAHAWEWAKELGNLEITFNSAGEIKDYTAAPSIVADRTWMRIYDLQDKNGRKKRVEFVNDGKAFKIREYNGETYSTEIINDPGVADDQYDKYFAAYKKAVTELSADNKFYFATPDEELSKMLQVYTDGVSQFRTQVVSRTQVNLNRGLNSGPGPLIADAMLWKTKADIAIANPGGVRTNIPQGDITVAGVYELQPFGNTLVIIRLTGAEVIKALEDMVDFQVSRYGAGEGNPYAYVAGIDFDLYPGAEKGKRVRNVRVKAGNLYQDINSAQIYKLVVNNFMAGGGDNNITLKNLTDKYDTGYIDAEIFMEYIKDKTLSDITEMRINVKY